MGVLERVRLDPSGRVEEAHTIGGDMQWGEDAGHTVFGHLTVTPTSYGYEVVGACKECMSRVAIVYACDRAKTSPRDAMIGALAMHPAPAPKPISWADRNKGS